MKKPILPLVLLLITSVALLSQENATYRIVRYDNLWNLAKEYLGGGERWRDIWELNSYIHNPDLIYPGNQLIIPGLSTDSTAILEAKMNAEAELYNREKTFNDLVAGLFADTIREAPTKANNYAASANNLSSLDYSSLFTEPALRATPFIWTEKSADGFIVPGVGRIDDKSRQLYNKNRTIQVVPDKGTTFAIGDTFDIFRSVKNFKHNDSPVNLVEPVGTGVIVNAKVTDATLKITELWGVVKHGDRLVPASENRHSSRKATALQKSSDELEAKLLTKVNNHVTIHPFEMLILDKGTTSGVKAGDMFHVYEMIKDKKSEKIAPFPSMEGVIVVANDKSATIKITNITKEVRDEDIVFKRYGNLILR